MTAHCHYCQEEMSAGDSRVIFSGLEDLWDSEAQEAVAQVGAAYGLHLRSKHNAKYLQFQAALAKGLNKRLAEIESTQIGVSALTAQVMAKSMGVREAKEAAQEHIEALERRLAVASPAEREDAFESFRRKYGFSSGFEKFH